MSNWYKASLKQGRRSDSLEFESPSITKAKNFLEKVSTANIQNIKKVVYSKGKEINYTKTNHIETKYNDALVATVQTNSKTHLFKMKYPKQSLTKEQIENKINNMNFDAESTARILSITIKQNEGFSPNQQEV